MIGIIFSFILLLQLSGLLAMTYQGFKLKYPLVSIVSCIGSIPLIIAIIALLS